MSAGAMPARAAIPVSVPGKCWKHLPGDRILAPLIKYSKKYFFPQKGTKRYKRILQGARYQAVSPASKDVGLFSFKNRFSFATRNEMHIISALVPV